MDLPSYTWPEHKRSLEPRHVPAPQRKKPVCPFRQHSQPAALSGHQESLSISLTHDAVVMHSTSTLTSTYLY